jgi:hypothetical protein
MEFQRKTDRRWRRELGMLSNTLTILETMALPPLRISRRSRKSWKERRK